MKNTLGKEEKIMRKSNPAKEQEQMQMKSMGISKHPCIWTFFVTCILFWVFLFFTKTYPFGDDTLLIWDADRQYLPFYAHMKTGLLKEGFWDYSWAKSLGGETRSLFAYYCASPFYFLFLFVPKSAIPMAVILVIMLKYATAAAACSYCLDQFFERKSVIYLMVASISYAFMGYNIAYSIALSWLDGVMLLPLVVLGLHRLITQKKPLMYIISLAISIAANFYIGYMVCIFSVVLYFVMSAWEKCHIKGSILRFGLSSLAAGGISCVVWLPIIQSLKTTRIGATNQTLEFKENFNFFDIFAKMYTGTTDVTEIKNEGLPQIYIGILMMFLAVLYLANKNIALWKKISCFGIITFLCVSFQIYGLNIMWHGFSANACFNYRYSFLLCFVLIVMAYDALNQIGEMEPAVICKAFVGFLALTLLVYKQGFRALTLKNVYLDLALLLIFVVVAVVYIAKKKAWLMNLAVCLQAVLMIVNATLSINQIRPELQHNTQSEYTEYLNNVQPAIDAVKEMDDSFYRMEKDFSFNGCYENEPMLFDYRGISHFSSTMDESMRTFIKAMGFHQTWMCQLYGQGSTDGANDLLGIKYLLTKNEPHVSDSYEWVKDVNDIHIYENKNVLGIAALADSLYEPENTSDPFTFMNGYLTALDQTVSDIYTLVDPGEATYLYTENGWDDAWGQNKLLNVNDSSRMEYTITIDRNEPLYMRMESADYWDGWNIYVNGEYKDGLHPNQALTYLGTFDVGDQVTISLQPPTSETDARYSNILIGYENTELLDETIQTIKKRSGELRQVSNTKLEGSIDVDEDGKYLIFTIPYDDAWKVTVDGEKVETYKTAETLLAIDIPAGAHEYKLEYKAKGTGISLVVTIASIGLVVFYERKKKKGSEPETTTESK